MHTFNETAKQELVFKHNIPSATASSNRPCLNALQRDSAELHLLKLLQQHRHADGWIVLVAPAIKPNKAFWAACQLPLDKILIVHQHQIKNITATLSQAIQSVTCKVIINCAPLSETESAQLTEIALKQQSRFYPLHNTLTAAH